MVVGTQKKTTYRYVAIVQNVTEEKIELLGIKLNVAYNISKVVKNDKFIVNFSDIIALLPDPKEKYYDG